MHSAYGPIYVDGSLQIAASFLHALLMGVAIVCTPKLAIFCHSQFELRERQAKHVHPRLELSPGLLLGPPASVRALHYDKMRKADTLRGWREGALLALDAGVVVKLAFKVRR
jgi:hypothetical protein